MDEEVGIRWRYQPTNAFLSTGGWVKPSIETGEKRITLSLFADDTTILGRRAEIEEETRSIKRVMKQFEDKNNEDKEERLDFGSEEGRSIRMLGCWIGAEEYVKNRKKRAEEI